MCKILENICKHLLRYLGYTLPEKTGFDQLFSQYSKADLKNSKTLDIDIFGYKTSKNIVVVFSCIVIAAFLFTKLLKIRLGFSG